MIRAHRRKSLPQTVADKALLKFAAGYFLQINSASPDDNAASDKQQNLRRVTAQKVSDEQKIIFQSVINVRFTADRFRPGKLFGGDGRG